MNLAETLEIKGPFQLGYIVLPKDVNHVGRLMADWDAAQLTAAGKLAIDIARRIHRQEFWPPTLPAPDILTDYAVICQDNAFRPQIRGPRPDGGHPMSVHSHVLISASAGTGKTFQLSNRYIGLLHSGVLPDQILATTFTRKAAGEILDRVIVRLADAALDAEKRQKLAEQLAIASLTQSRCYELLGQMLHQLHRLRVSTLDAFFAQLAGSFSLELGLPTGWRIIEELHEKYLRTEAIERTLQGDSTHDVHRLLQLMAKGTAQRSVSDLVRDTVNRLYNLFMETDAAAWQQIPQPPLLSSERLAALIQELRNAALPADKNFAKARDKDLAAAEIGDWESFIGSGLAAKVLEEETTYCRKTIPAEVVQLYQQLLGQARGVLLKQMAGQTQATYDLLAKFHVIYAQLKQQSGALRFEDITRALAASDRLGSIDDQHFRLDTYIAHLLLDEFQDTSLTQWQVLRPLARFVTASDGASTMASAGGRRSFFCVGDAKQAIYAWRGGKSEIFEALDGDLVGLEKRPLTKSFRSSPPVIDAVNRIFRELPRHTNLDRYEQAVHQWCDVFPEHTTSRFGLPGYVELRTAREAGDGEHADSVKLAYAAELVRELIARAPGSKRGSPDAAERHRESADLRTAPPARGGQRRGWRAAHRLAGCPGHLVAAETGRPSW